MQFQKNNLDKYKNSKGSRRLYIQDNTPEQEYGEMAYTEPNLNQISSPMMDSQEQDQNEQMMDLKQETPVFQTFGKGIKNRPKMGQMISEQPIPSYNEEDETYERNPATLNIGSSRDDYEYRPIVNPRRSQNYGNEYYDENQQQYDDDDYQEYQNETEPRVAMYRSRSPEIGPGIRNMSPPAYGGVIPMNHMSPQQNYDEFNSSTEKNPEQFNNNNLKNYLGNTTKSTYRQNPTYLNPNMTLKTPSVYNILRDEVSHKYNNQTYNNMSYKDIKKIANRFSKIYDPHKNKNGLLLEESQVTVPGAQDEVFNNRYKVLSKMNRLSNILLAQKNKNLEKKENEFNTKTYNRNNSYNSNTRKPFNRHTLARSPENASNRRAFSRSPDHKFLYVSLAMISSKGPSTEDRPILRWMRLEKGGVVDLAQEDRRKNKFKIKKAMPKKPKNKGIFTNPKYREKAAKIIQGWWRDLKNIYNDRLAKIIKIQSVFRGRFVRKYMYDLFYLNFLYISFCKKIENVLSNHVRPYVWDKLFGRPRNDEEETPRRDRLLGRVLSRDYRNDLNAILPAWKKWLSNTRRLNMQNYKGRNLVQIRSDKENRLNEIRNAFNKWKYVNKVLNAQDKLLENENEKKDNEEDRERNLEKIKGFFHLVDGIDKFTKKEAMNNTLPKIEDYLRQQRGKGKLRKIVYRKPNYNKNILRRYLYRWYGNAVNDNNSDLVDRQKQKMDELKKNIFKNIVIKMKNKQQKNILRKYFYKWLKKTIKLAIQDEREKNKNKEKEYKDKEYEIIETYEKKITTFMTQKEEDDEASRKIRDALQKMKKESKEREDELIQKLEESKDNKDKNLLNYLKGSEILQRAVWRISHPDPLHAMGEKLDVDDVKYKLLKMIKIKKRSDKDLLRKYFNIWRKNALKGIDADILYKLLAKLMEMTHNNHMRKILGKKFNKWRRAARINPYDSLQKAKDIYDLGDLIRRINIRKNGEDFLDKLSKTRNPHKCKTTLSKIVKKRDLDYKDDLRKAFDKWRKVVEKENVKRLKYKLIYKIYKKNNDIDKDLLNKYFQIWKNKTFKDNLKKYKNDLDKINLKSKETTRIFVKSIVNGLDKRTNQDLLREYFNRWKKILEDEKEENYKKNKKKLMLLKIVEKKSNNNNLNLLQYLLRWKNKMYELRAAEAHKPYRKKVIKILLTKNDKEELQRCFTKWKYSGYKRLPIMPYIVAKRFLKKVLCRRPYREFVKKMTERNPEVLKKKGKDLFNTLKKMKDNREKDFLLKLIKFIQRKYLGKIQPKVNDKVKEYYLKKYFDRWVENTIIAAEKRREFITNWLKDKLAQDKLRRDERINELLNKFLDKIDRNKNLYLSYGFYKYYKNTKLDIQIENAKIIQDFCRNVLSTTIKDRLENQKKLKDLINKLYREKFLNDLNDLANSTSPILKDNYKKRKYRLDKLKKVVDDNDKNNRKDILRKYWNIWKNNKGLYEKYSIIIQKEIRKLISRKKLGNIKKLNEILYKMIMINEDKEKDIIGSRFYQWLKKTKALECQENARIIQKFCRNKLNDYLRNKLAKYLDYLSKEYTTYLINNGAKVDKLNKALRHNPLKNALDAIKRRALLNDIKDALINLLSKQDDKNRKTILRHYLEKWNKKANQLKNLDDDMASRIQAAYRGYNFRKLFYIDEKRIKILKIIVEKVLLASEPNKILNSAIAKWRKNARKIECHENAKIIQDFCREIQQKILDDKNRRNMENYKNLANTLNNLKASPKDFFDRLKEIRRNKVLEDLLNDLANKRLDNLKDAFDKIREAPKYKYLNDLLNLKDDLRDRILRKYLNIWRNKAMRYKGIMELLKSIFNTYDDFKNNLLRYNLYRWQMKAKYLTQLENARIIQRFCKPILKKNAAIRNWHKLADGLRNKNRGDEVDDALNKLRNLLGFNKLKRPLRDHARKDVFNTLKKNKYMDLFIKKIRPYFDKNDEFWRNNLLREYFDRWRNNALKLTDKERRLKEVMDILDKLRKKNAADAISDASLVKKLLHDLPLIRALGFLRKLKRLAKERGKNDNLARDLIDAKEDLEPKKRANLIKKLFKVYAYKVLSKLFDKLDNIQKRNAEPLKRQFFDTLYKNLLRQAERLYSETKENQITPTNKKTSFRLKKPTKIKDDQKKKLIYVSLLPSLVNYINQKILDKKQDAFDALKDKYAANKFCDLYKRWTEKQELEPKKELVDKLRRIYKRVSTEGPLKLKLFKMLRREAIRRMLRKSKKVNKVLGMMYVTRLLIMQREIAKEKFLRQLIRRWRYINFSKKLALKKMKTIYKNLHLTYLEMSNMLFGEESNEPSVIKEFERFGTSVGMWENEKPKEKGEEKYVKTMKTQYVFDPIEFEKYQNQYYPTEVEQEEYYEEDVKEVEKEKYYEKYKGYKGYKDSKKK